MVENDFQWITTFQMMVNTLSRAASHYFYRLLTVLSSGCLQRSGSDGPVGAP